MKDDERDKLDILIDGALSGYSSARPMEGLEQRVLRRISLTGARRRRVWFVRFGLAAPALAALLLAAIVMWWNPRSKPVRTRPARSEPNVAVLNPPAAVTPAPELPAKKPKLRNTALQEQRARYKTLPKEERFPAPVSMTAEEQALFAWARQAPAEVRQAFVDLRARSDEPVAIHPIQIPPLQSDGSE
jgi:hypothetical protein